MRSSSVILFCFVALVCLVSFASASGADDDCCNFCLCTKSLPPYCRCADVKTSCPASCKNCACTKSIPPQCTCNDVGTECTPPACLGMSTNRLEQ
ncbi:hypothetical protein ACHQM5_006301 [Ranunculus cassubicifolius]